jgi:hypothetical protein
MNYYGRFGRSRLYRLLQRINTYIEDYSGDFVEVQSNNS